VVEEAQAEPVQALAEADPEEDGAEMRRSLLRLKNPDSNASNAQMRRNFLLLLYSAELTARRG
jgi:hypothetical protein